jgi:hypothetical protein
MNFYKLKLNSGNVELDSKRGLSHKDILFFCADTSIGCIKAVAEFCMFYTLLLSNAEFNSAIRNVLYSDYNFDDVNFIRISCSISSSSEEEYKQELDKLLISENSYNILIITYDRNKNSISVSKNFASCDD